MDIPIRPAEAGDPWTFAMAFAEQAQLTTKVAALLSAQSVALGALSVDVDNQVVSATVTFNDTTQPVSVPAWRATSTLTIYPANYVADRLLEFFGLPGTP